MHTNIVLVVSRTHWRCLTCKVYSKRSVSIDQHLLNTHTEFGSASVLHSCSHSDGELDADFQYKEWFLKLSPVTDVKEEISQSHAVTPRQGDFTEPPASLNRTGLRNRKRKALGKPVSLSEFTKTENMNTRSGTDSDADYMPDAVHAGSEDDNKKEENWACAQRTSIRLRKKFLSQHTKGKTRGRIETAPSVSMETMRRKPLKLKLKPLPAAKLPKIPATGQEINAYRQLLQTNKGAESKPNIANEKSPVNQTEKSPVNQTEKSPVNQTEAETVNKPQLKANTSSLKSYSSEEKPRLRKRSRVSAAPVENSQHKSTQIDKSNIATSCVPWLLDTGRKAGDKVTKRTRRSLPPEEKQAIRELYGIPVLKHLPDTPPVNAPREANSRHRAAENQAVALADSFLPPHSVHVNSVQPLPVGENISTAAACSHQKYMINTFSLSTRDFFTPDNAQSTRENLISSYNSGYTQPNPHVSHYTSEVSEFYPSTVSILPQGSNLMNFQGYDQGSIPTMPTPSTEEASMQHQVNAESYLGKSFGVNSIPQSQFMPAPVSSASCSVLQTPALSNMSTTKTDLAADSGTPATSSQKHQPRELVFDSNPDNQCRVCENNFQSPKNYEDHLKDLAGFDLVECKRCRSKFHGSHELNLHVFSAHETEKCGFCFFCDQDAAGMEDLEKHIHRHAFPHRDIPSYDLHFHDCCVCNEELPNAYMPIRTHYYQNHACHVCSQCYLTFRDFQAYKDHHAEVHKAQQRIFCSICGSKFESSDDLEEHTPCPEDIWAEDGKGEVCLKCGLWCPNRAVVEAHRKQHRSQEDVEAYRQGAKVGFPCTSCEKVFKNKHACRRHVKMVHEGVSCYKHYCEYCGKGFLTKGHMRDHIALHHLNIKRYKCDYCEQQFVCGPTLRRHVRVEHTKHRPYQCPHCDQRFFEKTPLQRHLTVHTGLAPFMCEHCGKGFYTKHSFRNHRTTHSTVKEFVCMGCQKGFTRKYNLHAHTKICKML